MKYSINTPVLLILKLLIVASKGDAAALEATIYLFLWQIRKHT